MEQLLTTTEAAEFLRVTRQYLYALVASNQLRNVRVGNAYRFRKQWLEAYLEAKAKGGQLAEPVQVSK